VCLNNWLFTAPSSFEHRTALLRNPPFASGVYWLCPRSLHTSVSLFFCSLRLSHRGSHLPVLRTRSFKDSLQLAKLYADGASLIFEGTPAKVQIEWMLSARTRELSFQHFGRIREG